MMIGFISKQSFHLSITNSDNSTNKITQKGKTEEKNNSNNKALQKNDPLKNLMEQKQNIEDNKQKYLDNVLKKNSLSQSDKENLAEYDKQIAEIDKQINEIKLEEEKKKLGTESKDKENKKTNTDSNEVNSKNNNESDKNKEMMNNLTTFSNNMSQAKILSDEKKSESGRINVLQEEIKLDSGRSLPVNTSRKQKEVSKLQDNIVKIEKTIGEKLNPNVSAHNSNKVDTKEDENKDPKNNSNESIKDSKTLQTIDTYKENSEDKTQANGQKLNSIA